MYSFLEYQLKAGISLAVLYLFYWIFLRRDTSFTLNRLVLAGSVLLSLLIPLVNADFQRPMLFRQLPVLMIDFDQLNPVQKPAGQVLSNSNPVQAVFGRIPLLIYLLGAGMVFARLLYQAIYLHAVSRMSRRTDHNGYSVFRMNTDTVPFSYLNRIFIPSVRFDESALDSIVAHEQSHLRQGHYFDLFVVELATVIQWFNPFIWLFEKAIKETHEYLADEAVLQGNQDSGKYQAIMVNQAMGGPVFILTNQFNQSLIKKRIMMMRKMKTPPWAKLKGLLVLPLLAGLVLAFAEPVASHKASVQQKEISISGSISDAVTGSVLPGAIVLIKGSTNGTISDKQGNYKLLAGDNAVLVISIVGYKTREVEVQKNQVINVLMDQDAYVVDLNAKSQSTGTGKTSGANTGNTSNNSKTFVATEELPHYEGGMEALMAFIGKNLRYPEEARKAGIEGKVFVNFIVDANGKVSQAKIMRSVSPSLNGEALRLVGLMTAWKPALQNGEPLSAGVTLPIEFKLE
jgi:TonB family protein